MNLASRVEAMTRQYDAELLGFLPIRGRQDPVAVYRVHRLKEERPR